MGKTLKAAAVSLAIAAGAVLAAPGSATAATNAAPAAYCDRGMFCAWANDGFSGTMKGWWGDSPNWGTMNDDAESIWNRHPSSSTVRDNVQTYLHENYSGKGVCVLPNEQFDSGMNDNDYSSHALVHNCGW